MMKKKKITYEVWTGPLSEDWLTVEFLYDGQHFATLTEWGEKIEIYPNMVDGDITLDVNDFIELLIEAREHVKKQQ